MEDGLDWCRPGRPEAPPHRARTRPSPGQARPAYCRAGP